MSILYCLLLTILLWTGSYTIYLTCNHGLAPNARLQQLLRYLAASIVAALPLTITATSPLNPTIGLCLTVAGLWAVTYPMTYHLTNRKSAPDYDHQIDPAFAIYLFGWLSAMALYPYMRWVIGILSFVVMFICLFQWVYYFTCHTAVDVSGMKMLQETHYNEIIEFLRSYSLWRVIIVSLLVIILAVTCIYIPVNYPTHSSYSWWQHIIVIGAWCFMTIYMFKPHHGLLVRTGLFQLYQIVREYVEQNKSYAAEQQQRLATLNVRSLHSSDEPHTLLVVIGESASRDYMSAFTKMEEDTTPWLRSLGSDTEHCILYPHAYSCDIQTVPTLEKALTEYNQYSDGAFYTSCSIVDIAHKAGYRVHWYSNQGHLGAADTPITLVANTADVAKWTHQELGKPQYDETLIDFLDEIDPAKRNLVVLHLKGSHFNYENRFTEATRQWGKPGSHDQIVNYKNTLYYTDTILKKAFDFCTKRLNLQAMVYFSDHADVPDRHRQPNFEGFRDTRIPLAVWLSDSYQTTHQERTKAFKDNHLRYWTNDLAYELVCGLIDIESNHYRDENSLASAAYRFSQEELMAMNGKIHIVNDKY